MYFKENFLITLLAQKSRLISDFVCFKQNEYKTFWIFITLVSIFYLIVALHTPLSVLAWQAYDDMLFINHAQSLAEGRWLGKFSELTLVKGPGYPFFLAFNYWLGLPITFAHALFYCLSLLSISLLVLKISKSFLLATLVFLITLWDPRVFELNRVVRDAIYSGQAILVITIFSYLLLSNNESKNHVKLSVLSGVLLGWFWLTREEGVWLIPSLVFLIIFAFIRNKHQSNKIKIIRPILISFVTFAATLFIFNLGNRIAYGDFTGVDLKEKNFQSAYKSMESIRIGEQIPFVSVPRKVRMQIYKISPAFSELKKYIDPEESVSVWEAGGCSFRPTSCGDISNGFFYFALREAASKEGYYSSPKKASEFFKLINTEIQNACNENRLVCEVSHIPYMPPITIEQIKSIPATLQASIYSIFSAGTFYDSTPWKIWGPEYTFNRALSILNYPAHYPMIGKSSNVELAGWYQRKGKGNDWFQLMANDDYNVNIPYDLRRVESPDLVKSFNDKSAAKQRFKINTRCSEGCKLTFISSVGTNVVLSLKQPQKYISNNDITIAFDYINTDNNTTEAEFTRIKFSSTARSLFYKLYKLLLPTLLSLGLLCFVLSCYFSFKRSTCSLILVVSGTCWLSIITRAAILTMVDISAFPAVIVPYMQPIFTLSIIASILSIGALLHFRRKDAIIKHELI
jgi:hypothetical protein